MKAVFSATRNGLSATEAKLLRQSFRSLNPGRQNEAASDLVRANANKVFNAVVSPGSRVEVSADAFIDGAAKANRNGVTASEAKMLRGAYRSLNYVSKEYAVDAMLRGNQADAFNAAADGKLQTERTIDADPMVNAVKSASVNGVTASEAKMLREAYRNLSEHGRKWVDEFVLDNGLLAAAAAMKGIK
jgi:hypothetical protein